MMSPWITHHAVTVMKQTVILMWIWIQTLTSKETVIQKTMDPYLIQIRGMKEYTTELSGVILDTLHWI